MLHSFFGFVAHVGKAKGFASNFAIARVDHEMMFFTKFPRQLQDVVVACPAGSDLRDPVLS